MLATIVGTLTNVILNYIFIFVLGINLTTTMYYQAIETPKYSNLICALRSIIVLPIILIVFSITFGANGIWISMAVSELLILTFVSRVLKISKYTNIAVADAIL